ncbi:uncharacterized protein [Asterias amurensis]|uniref:uncharacterized protein n=1 Tax=Asterias amurensis TaxID=7602 RepID=UPI003AB2ED06
MKLLLITVLLLLLKKSIGIDYCYNALPKMEYRVMFHTHQVNKSWWALSGNLTWNFHTSGIDGYTVRLFRRENGDMQPAALPINKCSLSGLHTTLRPFYDFESLQYGYNYVFGISTFNRTTNKRLTIEKMKEFTTPDCYLETGDAEFCRTQSFGITGVPVDFHLDCAVKVDGSENQSMTYSVVLSWTPPVQVRWDVIGYDLKYGFAHLDPTTFKSLERTVADNETVVYTTQIDDLQTNNNYTALLKAFTGGGAHSAFTSLNFSTSTEVTNFTLPNPKCVKLLPPPFDMTTDRTPLMKDVKPTSKTAAFVIGLLLPATTVVIVFLVVYYIKKRRGLADSKEAIFVRYPGNSSCRKSSYLSKDPSDEPLDDFTEPDADFQWKEIDRSLLKINEKLGNGQFGIVYQGTLSPKDCQLKKFAPKPVAVKSLKLNATRAMKEDFLDEIKLIIDIGTHPNILCVLGCCTVDEPYYLITEFMKYGDLLHFLWKCRDEKYQAEDSTHCLTETGQLQIARQIARGMEYLSNTRYYHGDLAARNILVGEGLVVKISDFGMAADIYQRGYQRLGQEKKRPLKWVSLETNIKGTCSIKSDVWSFGIVLYEIYTLGGVPYPGLDGFEVVRKLEDGYRMEQPDECPDGIYPVMLECWHEKPDLRPTFTDLFNKLDNMLSEMSSDYFNELDFDPDNISHTTDTTTTYAYENQNLDTRPLPCSAGDEDAPYDSLQIHGRKQVPRVTVECVDSGQVTR